MDEIIKEKKRANELNGSDWTKNSISIWSDIRKTSEEKAFKHPAMFPGMLIEKLLKSFTRDTEKNVLDPFSGSGTTLVTANEMSRYAIGFEINPEYIDLAKSRLEKVDEENNPGYEIHNTTAYEVSNILEHESVDICITSPPYWDILNCKRTADYKAIRHYGNKEGDLGTISNYTEFIDSMEKVFSEVYKVLKPNKYCIVNVMDLRKTSTFYPFHMDLSLRMQKIGYILDDIIIWDRRQEYNNLRALGYPSVFRLNKVHEFVLIFKKPLK